MTSIDVIVAHQRQAVDHLHQAVDLVRGARDMAEELHGRVDALGVQDLVERMRAVVDRAREFERMLRTGIDLGEQLIAQTEAVRRAGTAGSVLNVPARGTRSSTPAAPAAGRPAPAPASDNPPRWVRHWARRLPIRAGGKGPTHGQLLDTNGVPAGPVRSREDPSLIADLDLNEQERSALSMLSHAEAHTAAKIRRGEAPRDAVLILNNDMCAGRYSCQSLLRGILPAGARLTVYVARPDGTLRRPRTFEGTGERIRR